MVSTQESASASAAALPDEEGIAIKVYNAGLLAFDVILMLFHMLLVNLVALYRFVVPPEEKDVRGEIILITGTGHGIGRETALQYSTLGAILVCLDINEKGNQETVDEIQANGGKAYGYVCNVSDRQNVMDVAEKIRREVGEVSVLVNNAGIMPCHSMLTHTEEEIKKLYDVNVFAHFWLLQAYLPSMISRNHGHIVALSSMAGVLGLVNLVPYCGSKFAVRGIMEALSEEIRSDERQLSIKFTTIYPYIVDTGLCQKPKIRFPGLMGIVKPKEAARLIIQAMRRNQMESSIPSSLLCINNICRNMPPKVGWILKDFLDSNLEPHV